MVNFDQNAILSINDSSDDISLILSCAFSFNQSNRGVFASFKTNQPYEDINPIFDFFAKKKAATLKIEIRNEIDSRGATLRTITLEKAVCVDYTESFTAEAQTTGSINDYIIVFSVQADSATMGSTSFPT